MKLIKVLVFLSKAIFSLYLCLCIVKTIKATPSQYGFETVLSYSPQKFIYSMKGLDLQCWNSWVQQKTTGKKKKKSNNFYFVAAVSTTKQKWSRAYSASNQRRLNYLRRVEISGAIVWERFWMICFSERTWFNILAVTQ